MKGMTLIEILLAMMILTVMTIFSAQSMREALDRKNVIQADIDHVAQIRDVLRVIEKDIHLAFHYRDSVRLLEEQVHQELTKKSRPTPPVPPTGQPPGGMPGSPPPAPPAPTTQVSFKARKASPQYTQFIGEKESLHFTSLNNVRTIKDSPVSDQMEVGYFLRPCKQRKQKKSTQCLWRRKSPYLDRDTTAGGREIPLIENVDSLKFRYLGETDDEWKTSWKTDSKSTNTLDQFPAAVEISLEVKIPNSKRSKRNPRTYSVSSMALIRFPNNGKPTME